MITALRITGFALSAAFLLWQVYSMGRRHGDAALRMEGHRQGYSRAVSELIDAQIVGGGDKPVIILKDCRLPNGDPLTLLAD